MKNILIVGELGENVNWGSGYDKPLFINRTQIFHTVSQCMFSRTY